MKINKSTSLKILECCECNIATYVEINTLEALKNYLETTKLKRVSIRTWNDELYNTDFPYIGNVSWEKALETIEKWPTNLKYIVFRSIPYEETMVAGKARIRNVYSAIGRPKITLEYKEGHGHVRQLDKTKPSEMKQLELNHETINKMYKAKAKLFSELYDSLLTIADYFQLSNITEIIVEWSFLRFNHGNRKKQVIFWEIQKGAEK